MNNNFQTRQQSLRHFRHSLGNRLRQISTSLKLFFLHYVAYKYQYKISIKLKKKEIT